MTTINKHLLPLALESFLGTIRSGWDAPPPDIPNHGIQVARFSGTASNPAVVSTVGLGDIDLASRQSGRQINLEILMPEGSSFNILAAMLFDISSQIIEKKEAILRGDYLKLKTLGYFGDWFGLYFTNPIFIDGETEINCDSKKIVLAWAIPIKQPEARFIDAKGWEAWEELLEENFGTLADLDRSAFVVDKFGGGAVSAKT
ncbi:suppressor of fused domain protein [Brevundimonas sp.]|uniref:suppressor of fused domain protein n=1 Tax=Brevundimonas sp. TaxID=1871086 RepID=UPI0035B18737